MTSSDRAPAGVETDADPPDLEALGPDDAGDEPERAEDAPVPAAGADVAVPPAVAEPPAGTTAAGADDGELKRAELVLPGPITAGIAVEAVSAAGAVLWLAGGWLAAAAVPAAAAAAGAAVLSRRGRQPGLGRRRSALRSVPAGGGSAGRRRSSPGRASSSRPGRRSAASPFGRAAGRPGGRAGGRAGRAGGRVPGGRSGAARKAASRTAAAAPARANRGAAGRRRAAASAMTGRTGAAARWAARSGRGMAGRAAGAAWRSGQAARAAHRALRSGGGARAAGRAARAGLREAHAADGRVRLGRLAGSALWTLLGWLYGAAYRGTARGWAAARDRFGPPPPPEPPKPRRRIRTKVDRPDRHVPGQGGAAWSEGAELMLDQAIVEAFEAAGEALRNFAPDPKERGGMLLVLGTLKYLPDGMDLLAEGLTQMANRCADEWPVKADIAEMIDQLAGAQRYLAELAETIPPAIETLHTELVRHLTEPEPGEAMWDRPDGEV